MYTITRKSSSRRQSSNSIDSFENVCSNTGKSGSNGPLLKRSAADGFASFLSLDDASRSCKSPALDLSCSPNRSRVVANWLNQSRDFLSCSSTPPPPPSHADGHLDGYGFLTPASPPASSRSPSPAPSSGDDFDDLSCCSRDKEASDLMDGMGYLTPPPVGDDCCRSPFSSTSSLVSSSSSSLFSSRAPSAHSPSSEEQFSCLYLLASAAVSELERQRASPISPATTSSVNSQTVPFKKRNHLRPGDDESTPATN